MRLRILPALGMRPVCSITKADVARFAGTLSYGRRPQTMARVLATLSALMAHLVGDGRIRTNTAAGQRTIAPDLPATEPHEMRPLLCGTSCSMVPSRGDHLVVGGGDAPPLLAEVIDCSPMGELRL
jgi:hypothetical protein